MDKKEKVYSFDIFDTLITRKTVFPEAVFLAVQEKIRVLNLPEFLKNNFSLLRKEAEKYCTEREFQLHNKFDCTINNIYEVIKNNYQLESNTVEAIKQLEIEEEINNAFPIIENINKVKNLISENKKVILISDMYLPSEVLREILVNIDDVFKYIEIYTSSDTGKRKSNGSLYRLIQEKYKIIEHTGDNEFSDVVQAKWNGIKANKVICEGLKEYEKRLIKKYPKNLYLQKSVGISRLLRQNSKPNGVFDFALSFAAPVLYGYTDWVLAESLRRGIKNLYFVARDGFVPKIIADIIIREKNYDIKTHYFYSSRRASRIAEEKNIEEYITQIFSELEDRQTEEFIAKRFEITKEELLSFGGASREKLLSNPEFKNLIINKHKEKKSLFLSYIRQEINFTEPFAFVDLNGSGRTQDNLAHLINDNICKTDIVSFYFSLQPNMEYRENSIKSAYINSYNFNSLFLELMCRTLHGQTLGYGRQEGKIVPLLEYDNNPNMEKWGFEVYLDGLKAYTKLMAQEEINNDAVLPFEYLNYLKGLIDRETADTIGSIPFGIYGDEKTIKEFIPKYTLFTLFQKREIPSVASSRANKIIKPLSLIINKIRSKKTYGFISKKRELAYLNFFWYKINLYNIFWKK
ncbi:hypothetical protein IKQ26_01330 [bacterium]|nr:hypothetical protein [bacterium]